MTTTYANDIVTEPTTIVAMDCGECGIQFGLDQRFITARREDHRTWYCPNGHPRCWRGETEQEKEVKRLRRSLEWEKTRAESWKDQAKAADYSRRAVKGQLTKVKKRVANGVCPCCNRTFQDLGRHMSGQHPDYTS